LYYWLYLPLEFLWNGETGRKQLLQIVFDAELFIVILLL